MLKIINRLIQSNKAGNTIGILTVLFYMCSCGTDTQSELSEFNNLKMEVRTNYNNNKVIFNELKSCNELKHIKFIEFRENGKVAIEYKVSDTSKWKKVADDINTEQIKSLLNNEGLNPEYLFKLKKKLNSINANSGWMIDLFNRYDGTSSKAMEIKYLKDVNGLHFFYKIFEKPLDSPPTNFIIYNYETASAKH